MEQTTADRQRVRGLRYTSLALLTGLSIAVGAFYVATLAPTIGGGDSGELTAVTCGLGVAHPPGYPLYTILARAFGWLPLGGVAWKLNLASAIFGLGAAVLVFLTIDRWLDDPWAALFGSGLFAFSGTVWRYATVAEVFSLNNLLVALLTYLMLCYWQSSDLRWAYAMALTVGAGFAHHHTIVFVALPFAVAVLVHDRARVFRPRTVGLALACFLGGLLPYLYLPWAASRRLISSWGDATRLDGFLDHVFRRDYGTFRLASKDTEASLFTNLRHYFADSAEQLLYVGLALALLGMVLTLRDPRRRTGFASVLFSAWLCYTAGFNALSNPDFASGVGREIQARFWQLPNLFLCLLAAVALARLAGSAGSMRRTFVAAVAVALVLAQIGWNYRSSDASTRSVFRDLGHATLTALPQGSILLTRGDVYVNAVRYLQECEGFRRDIVALPLDLLGTTWMRDAISTHHAELALPVDAGKAFELSAFLDRNPDRTILVNGGLYSWEREALRPSYIAWNTGAGLWLLPANTRPEFEAYRRVSEAYSEYRLPPIEELRDDPWAVYLYERYWRNEQLRAEQLSLEAADDPEGFRLVRHAAEVLERMIALHPALPPKNYRTLAFAYWKLEKLDDRYEGMLVEPLLTYLELNPDDPNRTTLEGMIRAAESNP